MFPMKVVSKASLIEKAAKKERGNYTHRERRKETEGS